MAKKQGLDLDERRKLADRLARLSSTTLILTEATERYISVDHGTGKKRNVMNVHENRVSLHIQSEALLEELTRAGISHMPKPTPKPWEKNRHWIQEMSMHRVDEHEDLFRKIVEESVQIIEK